eukprot:CAMPEP_0206006608 /NCGR_PEP_ID=MMETSP1464-20131121/5279_1 /ASSEMBLY_ACC=CAM_ASM_001124 /TAXON_ID=119497 /ORGANISM="Exanthemachrysis gayraliae, Strain RCC1523" /LENGTH=169 /DNA_ID=CAMNT_0053380089 /DNA_START=38 /DNA_END=547 /DNA_ORIENTATION=+
MTTSALRVAERVERVLAAKAASKKTYDQLAKELGVTNAYAAQLLLGQAQLKPATADKLRAALPGVSESDVEDMVSTCPDRTFDSDLIKEPLVYRIYEAAMHYARAIKAIVNERHGDGIMSAIDFYVDVGHTTGKNGERRVVITMNGKYLPHVEQRAEDNTAPAPRIGAE